MIKRNAIINKAGKIAPNFISRLFVNIPFSYRYGAIYTKFKNVIKKAKHWNEDELENYIVTHFDKAFQHAKKFELYKRKYKESGVLDLIVRSIDDILKIPILTRNEIRESIDEFTGSYYEKTGGTSGNPLQLYLDENIWAREWAHYHYIWKKADYKYLDAKFMICRENVQDKFIEYDFEHNQYRINTYNISENDINEFLRILIAKKVKYFHGYPSAIYDFLKEIENKISSDQRKLIQNQIKCCFFSSETPLINVTEYIRNVWNFDYLACYGHTECCVLAHAEKNNLTYTPLHTYGYVEDEGNLLVGTSYHNYDMPLIRYRTDDLIRSKKNKNGIVTSFIVKEGRVLDYFLDKNDLKVYYLDLFYETQGDIFKCIDYCQFYQSKKGHTTLLISHSKDENFDARALMDLERFNVDFDFIYLKKPIRTVSGKISLKVKELPLS